MAGEAPGGSRELERALTDPCLPNRLGTHTECVQWGRPVGIRALEPPRSVTLAGHFSPSVEMVIVAPHVEEWGGQT